MFTTKGIYLIEKANFFFRHTYYYKNNTETALADKIGVCLKDIPGYQGFISSDMHIFEISRPSGEE